MTMFRIRRKAVLENGIKNTTIDVENLMRRMEKKTDKLMDLRQDLKEWK